jgi:hypothetical protein
LLKVKLEKITEASSSQQAATAKTNLSNSSSVSSFASGNNLSASQSKQTPSPLARPFGQEASLQDEKLIKTLMGKISLLLVNDVSSDDPENEQFAMRLRPNEFMRCRLLLLATKNLCDRLLDNCQLTED